MTNEEIARFFNTARPQIQDNPNPRDPQVEGWSRTRHHFRNSTNHAILQIPVGCGKTSLMALLPFETAPRVGRVLVIAPDIEIRRSISAFDVARRECFWPVDALELAERLGSRMVTGLYRKIGEMYLDAPVRCEPGTWTCSNRSPSIS